MAESSRRSHGVLRRLRSAGRGLRRTMFGCVSARETDDRGDGRRPTERQEIGESPIRQPTRDPQQAVPAGISHEERPDEADEADGAGPSAPLAEPEETASPARTVTIVVPDTDDAVLNDSGENLVLNEPGINWQEMVEERDIEEESDTGSMTTHIPDRPDLGSVHEGDEPPMRSTAPSTIGSVGETSMAHSTETHGLKDSVLGRISFPSKSAKSADSHGPAPVIVEEEEADHVVEPADAPEARPLNLATETSIVGLSRHETSGNVYVLIKSGSAALISRLRPGEKVPDLSFLVASQTNEDVGMTVVEDHIVTSSTGQLLTYSLEGVREQETGTTRRVLDVAGRKNVVYTLLENGEVASYTVPELQRIAVVRPDSRREITRVLRMAILHGPNLEGLSVILAETYYPGGYVINLYAATEDTLYWDTCLSSILTQSNVATEGLNICFASANELIISHHTLLIANYARSTSKRILLDKITAICSSDNDRVLIVRNNQIEVLDLKEARGTLEYIDPTFNENFLEFNVDDTDVPGVRLETRLLWRLGSSGGIHRIAVNKQSGELIGMSRLGYVIVYGHDFSRPVDNYQLALPEGLPGVWRIDSTDEGEVIVISDRSVMTFSHDRQLRWRDDLPTLTWMVVCQGDKIFVLLRDEIVVYTTTISEERNIHNIEETSRIPLAVGDVDPRNARLAVHGDTIYFIPLRQTIFVKHVPLTGAFRRFARLPLDYPDCMCVDEEGRLIVGGWSESRGAEWRGLNIFAPDGELLRELQTADSIYEVAVCPGGGIFLRTSAGLRFMENYV